LVSFGQLTGDASFEWAALGEKSLRIGTWGKGVIATSSKAQFPDRKPQIFIPKNKRIGLVDPQRRRVWLLDEAGKTMAGFPLGGNTVFEFGLLNGVNMLVVGNGNGVWAYRVR